MSRSIALVIALAVLGAPAYAQDPPTGNEPSGLFVKGAGLGVFPLDVGATDNTGTLVPPLELSFDPGFGFMAGIGYTFDAPGSPVEMTLDFEYSFRRSDFDRITTGAANPTVGGHQDVHALMFDLVLDFELAGGFGAYVGAGIGVAISDATSGQVDAAPPVPFTGADKTTFAYQVTWGIKYAIDEHWVVYLGGRYFDAGKLGYPDLNYSYRDLAIELGARFYF